MGSAQLDLAQAREMLAAVAGDMIAAKDLLTQADKAIGDGDHGIGMARGFEAVLKAVEGKDFASLGQLFKAVGTALMASIGGAAGAVFGTLFRGGAANLEDKSVLTAETLSRFLIDGLRAVQDRGRAKPGDKTMVDALEPAARESEVRAAAPLGDALTAVAEAARLGMERTAGMTAAVGKAKTLGERSLGHPDPGAVSMHLILKSMAEFAAKSRS